METVNKTERKNMETACAYARISTKEQNIDTQLKVIREYCTKNGLGVVTEYADQGVSGAKTSRPQLDLMLKDVREGKLDTIVVYKLDRLGRSLKHLLDLLFELKNKKIRLISIADSLDTQNDSPMGRAFWQLLGVFAELEREILRARVVDGLERAKATGVKLGRPPGSTDKRPRAVSGYLQRYAGKTKEDRKLGSRGGKS